MDKTRKKELIAEYKQMKKPMGIYNIRSKVNNKCFLQTTKDLKGVMNSTVVKLRAGMHPNRELQKEWIEYGAESFAVEILENLEYDKDEAKTDYTQELELMHMLWEEKLAKENWEFYKKRI